MIAHVVFRDELVVEVCSDIRDASGKQHRASQRVGCRQNEKITPENKKMQISAAEFIFNHRRCVNVVRLITLPRTCSRFFVDCVSISVQIFLFLMLFTLTAHTHTHTHTHTHRGHLLIYSRLACWWEQPHLAHTHKL